MSTNNQPAFWTPGKNGSQEYLQEGMTLRDYFAGKFAGDIFAITTIYVTAPGDEPRLSMQELGQTAELAYKLADAMLSERSK